MAASHFVPLWSLSVLAVIDDWMIPFAAYATAEDPNAFHWAIQTLKFHLAMWDLDPSNALYFGPIWVSPQTASRPVQPFCRAHEGNKQTTLLVTPSVAIVCIVTIAVMRPNNNNNSKDNVSGASIMASYCESSTSLFTLCGAEVPSFRLCSSLVHSLPHLLLFITFSLFPFLIHFTYFLLLSIRSISTRIVPLRFQAIGRRRRSNLGLVCFVYYCVICIA